MNELDRQLLLALRVNGDLSNPVGPDWLQRAAIDVTSLGSHAVIATVVLFAAAVLLHERRVATTAWLVAATAGAMLLSNVLKLGFARARPDVVEHLVLVVTPAFPSGHALLSAAVYPLLAAVAAHGRAGRAQRRFLVLLSALLAMTIGISRVYLGVHWPTDVLAGWVVGAGWAIACWRLAPFRWAALSSAR